MLTLTIFYKRFTHVVRASTVSLDILRLQVDERMLQSVQKRQEAMKHTQQGAEGSTIVLTRVRVDPSVAFSKDKPQWTTQLKAYPLWTRNKQFEVIKGKSWKDALKYYIQGGVQKKFKDIPLNFFLSPLKVDRPTDT